MSVVALPSLQPTGSLKKLMDELVALENLVGEESGGEMLVYRWRPKGTPQLDQGAALYNWLAPSPYEGHDVAHFTDRVVINVHVGIRYGDTQTEGDKLERYFDIFRGVVDPALHRNQPLNGTCKRAKRIMSRMVSDTFGEIPILAIQSPIEFEMLRSVPGLY